MFASVLARAIISESFLVVAIGNLFVLLGKHISQFEKLDLLHGIYEVRSYTKSNPDAEGETNLAKASLSEWVW